MIWWILVAILAYLLIGWVIASLISSCVDEELGGLIALVWYLWPWLIVMWVMVKINGIVRRHRG